MNVLTIAALGFVVAVDRCGVLLRVPFIGEAWWDLSGQGLSCFDSWRRRGGRARQRRVIGHWLGLGRVHVSREAPWRIEGRRIEAPNR